MSPAILSTSREWEPWRVQPTGDGIYGAGGEKEESQDGHRRAKKEEPEGELPTTA